MPLKLSSLVDKYVVEVYQELHAAADAGRIDDFNKIAIDIGELNKEIQKLCDERNNVMFAFYSKLAFEWNRLIATKSAEKTPDLFTQPKEKPNAVIPEPLKSYPAEPAFESLPPATRVIYPHENAGTFSGPERTPLTPKPTAGGDLTGIVPNPPTPNPVLPPSVVPMKPPTVVLPSQPSAVPPQVVPNAPEAPAVQPTALKTVCSKDFWACDNAKCGSDDLEFRLSIMTVKQATDSSYVEYICRACGFKHGALLQRDEIEALAALEGSFVNPVTNAPATPVEVPAGPKKGRAKKSSSAPAAGQEGKADAKTFQVGPQKTSAEVKAIVQEVIKGSDKEVAENVLLDVFRSQVAGWPLEKLVKEWEGMTGKTYVSGTTVPASMTEDVLRQMAGLPVNV